ncbi:hypothetical protein [uncultured Hymenobacter sp.]|uniref:hypothetical protein n=1 Tax=uncultured Hymenobacter sp. TaxID=170016 RepID=UPI0035CB0986
MLSLTAQEVVAHAARLADGGRVKAWLVAVPGCVVVAIVTKGKPSGFLRLVVARKKASISAR